MTKLRQLIILSGAICSMPALALAADIKGLTAGGLQTAAASVSKNETTLTISGRMNAADFSYIQDNFNQLQALDLSNVIIENYTGKNLPYTGLSHSAAATIPPYSFTGLTSLKSVKLPAGLTAIGRGAFSGSGITTMSIPEGVKEIGDYAFMRCGNLESVNISASVNTIGERAFAYCDKLSTVYLAENSNLSSISGGLFEASAIKHLNLRSITQCSEIGAWAFAECNGLVILTLPKSIGMIDDYAMSGTSALSVIDAANVSVVPDLGENVWLNVHKAKVTLVAPDELIENYRSTLQWQDFNIIPASEYVEGIDTPASVTECPKLTIERNDNILTAHASMPLRRVSVYDVGGHLIETKTTENRTVSFNISGWTTGVYLIVSEAGIAKVSI